ncbi:diadenosine tetraphosphatase [Oceanobacillus picturae]|uniref:Diadenosine tetraphosphatase n=1 Tax=Oceanobacillus picturae TaxID=171693 RepID=W9AFV5_9BACI|nr:metallophosphoesterase [Oceanobacillus picturae]CDO04378.1 diadenosine tetraphosphatase [Oceanobacillus picturae]
MLEIEKLQLESGKRAIIVSDIHASKELFIRLLDKVVYTSEDYLFINGDLCEKGPNSLEAVRYAMELERSSNRVFITKGNCDILFQYVLDENEAIWNYIKNQPNSLLHDMLHLKQKKLDDFSSLKELGDFYREHFSNEMEWLISRPLAYETDAFILVHAGIENRLDWENTSEQSALAMPCFYEQGHKAEKPVIVGHWPAVNYTADKNSSNNSIIDTEKKIITMDGGNQIKSDGQLNAVLYENGHFSYTFVDEIYKRAIVQQEHKDLTGRIGTVTYPNYEFTLLKEDTFFTFCENKSLGVKQWVKNEYLIHSGRTTRSKGDVSTTFLSVHEGDMISIINADCTGYVLIKNKQGDVGWIPESCL